MRSTIARVAAHGAPHWQILTVRFRRLEFPSAGSALLSSAQGDSFVRGLQVAFLDIPTAYEVLAASRSAMNADSIQYALETDWPVGAAGFEPLHLEIRSAELHPASTGSRRRSGAP